MPYKKQDLGARLSAAATRVEAAREIAVFVAFYETPYAAAEHLEVSRSTLCRWIRTYEELRTAITLAKNQTHESPKP